MKTVIIRGAGDIATGIGWRLHRSGYRVLHLDIQKPLSIRRTVSFSQAIYDKKVEVEGVIGVKVKDIKEVKEIWEKGNIPVLIDEKGESIKKINPDIVIDAILAKKNLGTTLDMAKKVIGVGPGFEVEKDVHLIVETMRGHYLGKVIEEGSAIPNTGEPGSIGGYSTERVIYSPGSGKIIHSKSIGDIVKKGDLLGRVKNLEIKASIDGVLRGLIQEGTEVKEGLKIADIDPRAKVEHCFTISDKGRAIAGGVLEAILLNSEI